MCVVSFIGDHGADRFRPYISPNTNPWPSTIYPWEVPSPPPPYPVPSLPYTVSIPQHEWDALKQEMEELRELLKAAKRIDELTGQPDCEQEEKMKVLKAVADALGVDLTGIV